MANPPGQSPFEAAGHLQAAPLAQSQAVVGQSVPLAHLNNLSSWLPAFSEWHMLLWLPNWYAVQGRDVSSVRQYIESMLVNLMLQDPVRHMQQHVLPSLRTYHAR